MNPRDPLIIISGASSAAGKTTLAAAVVSVLRGSRPAAVKITITHELAKGCPRGGSGCGVCSSLTSGYRIVSDPGVLAEPGTDTARFLEAGADPVHWIISQPDQLAEAWADLAGRIPTGRALVVESNRLALLKTPDLSFFTINPRIPREKWKSSSEFLMERSDYLIVGCLAGRDGRAEELFRERAQARGGRPTYLLEAMETVLELPAVTERLQSYSRTC